MEQTPELKDFIFQAVNMSSPIRSVVLPLWGIDRNSFLKMAYSSNLTTFVLFDCEEDAELVRTIVDISSYSPSKLILLGGQYTPKPQGATKVNSHIEIQGSLENWRKYGALCLRRYLRNEHPPIIKKITD